MRSATLKATGPVKLWEIGHNEFQKLISRNPSIAQNALKVLSRYLREETRIVAELRTRDVDNRLKIAVFDSKPYTEDTFRETNNELYALRFFESRLSLDTVVLAEGCSVVCAFVNDTLDEPIIKKLAGMGVRMIAMRCAGYNNVDLKACAANDISIANVPAYSPHAVAEHAVTLMLALNRHIIRAHDRVREGNFSLNGLVGFDMFGKTVGVIGAGKIGQCVIDILCGFGCRVLVMDRSARDYGNANAKAAPFDQICAESDIITLHAPLVPETRHIVNAASIQKMKKGVMIINTSRGALVDAQALVNGLVSGQIGSAGLDVYEEEREYFFEDFSDSVMQDETLARLNTFHNVIVTGHMAFLTREALLSIAEVTFRNIAEFVAGKKTAEMSNGLLPRG
ncbi:MAG: 2-hydroxyacid dehydrogenase [Leptospirales bacterium]|nr:2-hydroxyacid dehydrogenase [Leptospirales bacterium]